MIILLAVAAIAYALCWYNFARVAAAGNGLQFKPAIALAIIGFVGPLLSLTGNGTIGQIGWIVTGIAMFGVAWAILKGPPLPNGFAWLSALLGAAVIRFGGMKIAPDFGSGPFFWMFAFTISMSILYIFWGHPKKPNPILDGSRSSR